LQALTPKTTPEFARRIEDRDHHAGQYVNAVNGTKITAVRRDGARIHGT
jgi:hypothetical protein